VSLFFARVLLVGFKIYTIGIYGASFGWAPALLKRPTINKQSSLSQIFENDCCKKCYNIGPSQIFLHLLKVINLTTTRQFITLSLVVRDPLLKGRLSMVDLLVKIACFVKKYVLKSSWFVLVITWRSIVLILPLL